MNNEGGVKPTKTIMTVHVTTNDPNVNPLEVLKRVYPEVVELADILRHYLVDANGQWHGSKLWMAVDIAQGTFGKRSQEERNDD